MIGFLRKLWSKLVGPEAHSVSRRIFLKALVSAPALAIPASLAIAPAPVPVATSTIMAKEKFERSKPGGWTGSTEYDAGMFYCPYIPLMS